MTIEEHCKAIEEFAKANSLTHVSYSPQFEEWYVMDYLGKGHKDAICFTSHEPTLEAAVADLKAKMAQKTTT